MDINMIVVSGNIAKSPTSTRSDDVLYVNFSLAVNIGSKESPKTSWYSMSASGKNAELILNHANVGDKLFITGKPGTDTYLGRDKQIISVQKVWVEKFEFCCAKFMENESHKNSSLTEAPLNSNKQTQDTENKTNITTEAKDLVDQLNILSIPR